MRDHPHPTAPRRLENGSIDLDFYIRRAHRLRSEEGFDRLQRGARFFTHRRGHDG